MAKLYDELKRRNVFRVAIAYIVSTWLILQVADVVLNNIDAPGWVFSVFLLALALGFLPVVFFSWAYEITPQGVKRESEVDRSRSITAQTGQKLNQVTIVLLVIVVAFVFVERVYLPKTAATGSLTGTDATSDEVTATAIDERSIAVLAFDDLSPEGDQAFFAEGLSEELLNVLAQVPELKVAGRTSSFAYKGKGTDLREIGEALNVAHILEGSVRKAGNRIRVTAQLIKASDGFHLFSQTYDRDLDDIFQVQDEIAGLISTSLKAELAADAGAPAATPTNLVTYDNYLLARQHIRTRNPGLMNEAIRLLDEALAIDPDYVPALVQRALALDLLSDAPGAYGTIPEKQAHAEARALLEKALEIDPENADAYAVLGLVQSDDQAASPEATGNLRHALALNPNHEDAKLWLGNIVDDLREAEALYEDVVFRDPLYGPAFNNLIQSYLGKGQFDKAGALVDRVSRIAGEDEDVHQALGTIAYMRGDLADAARHLQSVYDANPNDTIGKGLRSFVLLSLGELEQVLTEGADETQFLAYRELGDEDSADRLLGEMDFTAGDRRRKLWAAANYLVAVGRVADVATLVDDQFGGMSKLIGDLPQSGFFGTGYLGVLTYACLLEQRDDDARLLLGEMKSVLDRQQSAGMDNFVQWNSRAQYAVLSGDVDGAIEYLQHANDTGYVAAFRFDTVFRLIADDERFRAIDAASLARANEERRKLGLDPYRPVLAVNRGDSEHNFGVLPDALQARRR